MNRIYGYMISIMMACLCCLSCSKDVSTLDDLDRDNPFVKRAQELAKEGKPEAAVKLYVEALSQYPEAARIHLDIALLCHDGIEKPDYAAAIYHYNNYLALRPLTEKKKMVQERVRLAKQAFVAEINNEDTSSKPQALIDAEEEIMDLKEDVEDLQKRIKKSKAIASGDLQGSTKRANRASLLESNRRVAIIEKESADLKKNLGDKISLLTKANVVLRNELRQLKSKSGVGTVDRLELESVAEAAPQASGGRGSSSAIRSPEKSMARGGHRTYRVVSGDTLTGIAKKMYGDQNKWKLIREANIDLLGAGHRLKVGQILVVPPNK